MNEVNCEKHKIESHGLKHLPRISWCAICDRSLDNMDDIGPWNHLHEFPDHFVFQVEGRLDIYRIEREPSNG